MKFLLDMNMPPSMIAMLEGLNHECTHLKILGLESLSDIKILELAEKNNQVILTHDLDFGSLLAVYSKSKPSVVIFRIHKVNASVFFELLNDNFEIIAKPLEEGSLIIFDDSNLRIRRLPIQR